MTLQETRQFPNLNNYDLKSEQSLLDYLKEQDFTLKEMYEDIANNVNGRIRNDSQGLNPWIPTLSTSASETFTYASQYGWVKRTGLMVELWFDITWNAASGTTGDLYLELPYQVALSNGKPFVGGVQPSSITYTAGTDLVINAIPNTFRGEFWYKGNGTATGNQIAVASGELIGHIRYIGKENERV